jgi:hypothetical protein
LNLFKEVLIALMWALILFESLRLTRQVLTHFAGAIVFVEDVTVLQVLTRNVHIYIDAGDRTPASGAMTPSQVDNGSSDMTLCGIASWSLGSGN